MTAHILMFYNLKATYTPLIKQHILKLKQMLPKQPKPEMQPINAHDTQVRFVTSNVFLSLSPLTTNLYYTYETPTQAQKIPSLIIKPIINHASLSIAAH